MLTFRIRAGKSATVRQNLCAVKKTEGIPQCH